jgi:mono/diheme cytochrome c family protein
MAQADLRGRRLTGTAAWLLLGFAVCRVAWMPQRGVSAATVAVKSVPHLWLQPARQSASDLEIHIAGRGGGFVTMTELRMLPLVHTAVAGDTNFAGAGRVRVTGVLLDVLARALDVPVEDSFADAMCNDGYDGHYSAAYRAAHQPVLAFEINGEAPAVWAKKTGQYDPSPYFVTHADFVPAFRVLSHKDEMQVPSNVVALRWSRPSVLNAIAPPHALQRDAAVAAGFQIAEQNCLRCHFAGRLGGTKSGRDWATLSMWAHEQPAYFARYVHSPKSVDEHAQMPANPQYDAATLAALTAYFQLQGYHAVSGGDATR